MCDPTGDPTTKMDYCSLNFVINILFFVVFCFVEVFTFILFIFSYLEFLIVLFLLKCYHGLINVMSDS